MKATTVGCFINENKDVFDVLSIPNYVIKKGPFHGARHGPTEKHIIYFIACKALRKAKRKITNPFWIPRLTNQFWVG